MPTQITVRDIAILLDLYHYRYLSFSQLARLHFPSRQTAYLRLRTLKREGLVQTFTAPAISERIFHLDNHGAKLVAAEMDTEVEELSWYRYSRTPKDYYYLRHFLAINDFRILITQACIETPITLLGFIPEYIGEKTKQGHVKKYLRDSVKDYSHTPDGVFALEKDGNTAIFFLEIDRGLETVSDPEKGFMKCAIFYLNYFAARKYERYETDFGKTFKSFRTLVITPSDKRLQHMREAVTNFNFSPPQAKRFIWGTTEQRATRQLLFESIWQSMDTADQTTYKIG
jgi:protein involved in plasmid replication-relaxation